MGSSSYHSDDESHSQTSENIQNLARDCLRCLATALTNEEAQDPAIASKGGFWASRQFAAFNLWCSKVGVNDSDLRAIDIRLRDAPGIRQLIRTLLQSLKVDLNEFLSPSKDGPHAIDTTDSKSDRSSRESSKSFDSLTSSECSKPDIVHDENNYAMATKVYDKLRRHVEDTIDRLHGHAIQIDRAGASHRRGRIEKYRKKQGLDLHYFETIGRCRVGGQFPNASDNFRERIAQSYARRRIRFQYLEMHERKRESQRKTLQKCAPSGFELKTGVEDPPVILGSRKQVVNFVDAHPPKEDVTIYSATEITKLDFHSQTPMERPKRLETVASVALRHHGFPRPPEITDAGFKCPYCRHYLHESEIKKSNWNYERNREHVIQDFEPYFCTIEDCTTPFDVPNSFIGLLEHLQSHVIPRYDLELPSGDVKQVNEAEFEKDLFSKSGMSEQTRLAMKDASCRRGVFLFQSCPFCGGFPDEIHKQFPEPEAAPQAQVELRKHIKRHMEDIAFLLPPYREGLMDEDMKTQTSGFSSSSASHDIHATLEQPDDFKSTCDQDDCDCRHYGEFPEESASTSGAMPGLYAFTTSANLPADSEVADLWAEILPQSPRYDTSRDDERYYLRDKHLRRLAAAQTSINRSASKNYTIAVICAFRTEFVAARAFLDESYDGPHEISQNDSNDYASGKLGSHYLVIAASAGADSTASVTNIARNMLLSFPNIRLGLVIGIGGGAPSPKHDIRLGDIVIGTGGVLQYDITSTTRSPTFPKAKFSGRLPAILKRAINNLRAAHEIDGHQFDDCIAKVLGRWPRLRKDFSRPAPSSDKLYKSHVLQTEGSVQGFGEEKYESRLELRRERGDTEDNPAIHYGLIGSTNLPLKDALLRDTLAVENEVLCFETSTATLIHDFPFLAICGIGDYSDSHQSKEWHGFAAMVAAAYIKDLLSRVSPNQIEDEEAVHAASAMFTAVPITEDPGQQIPKWLSPPDAKHDFRCARSIRHKQSGAWFLESAAFEEWMTGIRRNMWLYGLLGCGKTILCSAVIDHIMQTGDCIPIYFFFTFQDTTKTTLSGMLRSLTYQVYVQQPESRRILEELWASHNSGKKQPSIGALSACLEALLRVSVKLCIVIDGLDQCCERAKLLGWITSCLSSITDHVQLLVASRAGAEFRHTLNGCFGEDNCTPVNKEALNADIWSFVGDTLEQIGIHGNFSSDVLDKVWSKIGKAADGMFLWAVCLLDDLKMCRSVYELETTLETIPKNLAAAYKRILDRTSAHRRDKMIRLLQFLVYARRPISLSEAVDMVAIRIRDRRFDAENRLPVPEEIELFCPGLINVVECRGTTGTTRELRLAHFSVKKYFETCDLESFQISKAHEQITRMCLFYLRSIEDPTEDHTVYDIRDRFPLAAYAAENWMDHGRCAESSQDLAFEMFEFLQNPATFRSWTRLLHSGHSRHEDMGGLDASSLYYACLKGLKLTVELLLIHGADINTRGGRYNDALQAASYGGYSDIVQILLENGADVNAQGGEYGNALLAATQRGHHDIARLLVEAGGSIQD